MNTISEALDVLIFIAKSMSDKKYTIRMKYDEQTQSAVLPALPCVSYLRFSGMFRRKVPNGQFFKSIYGEPANQGYLIIRISCIY
jgi:hypothetical protein